jgi:hypothetical protein
MQRAVGALDRRDAADTMQRRSTRVRHPGCHRRRFLRRPLAAVVTGREEHRHEQGERLGGGAPQRAAAQREVERAP